MRVGILAGGVGSRLSEETTVRPKPMVEVGGRPLLWHIMRHYSRYGHDEFAVALGYLGEYIKRWFVDFASLTDDLTVHTRTGMVEAHTGPVDDWSVRLIDTGQRTETGGRIKRLRPFLGEETCMVTWGDGVSDIDLDALVEFHRSHGKLATMTAVRPQARFGHIELEGDAIARFSEKPQAKEGWVNGAFFVFEPAVFDYIEGDETPFEREPLEQLAADRELMAYRHEGFWACVDTLRDKMRLQRMWEDGDVPWLP